MIMFCLGSHMVVGISRQEKREESDLVIVVLCVCVCVCKEKRMEV